MKGFDVDGIMEGADVKLRKKVMGPDGVEQIMTANWKHKTPGEPGSAYAGELRGGFSSVGNRAANNAAYAGADMSGQERAGVAADSEFSPVSMMTPRGQVSGSDRTIQSIMDAESVPFSRTATTNDVNAKSRSEYDDFNERSAANLRIMTGGRTSGGPEFGSEMDRGERTERAVRIMESGSARPDQRRLAAGTVARYMGEEEAAKSRISDQRIQQILSGGKVEEAQATAEGQMEAATATAAGHVSASREMAGAQRDVAVTGAGAQRDVAGLQAGAQRDVAGLQAGAQRDVAATGAGAIKYGADQETIRAREAAKSALDLQRLREMTGGAFQGNIVRHPSGYVGIWNDKASAYDWKEPPTTTDNRPLTNARGEPVTFPNGEPMMMSMGTRSNIDFDKLPQWKPAGNSRTEPSAAADPQRDAAMKFIRDNPNDPRVPAIRLKLGFADMPAR